MDMAIGRTGKKPILLRNGTTPVDVVKLDGQTLKRDEQWYQDLVDRNPTLLMADEQGIESPLLSLGTEYPTTHGKSIDNLFVTRDGDIVLVEDKLERNESSRRVIAQAIDYAQDLQTWSYEHLSDLVQGKMVSPPKTGPGSLLVL